MDEAALLRRVARGDQAAFDELYARTAPWLAVRLRRRTVDEDLIAESLQETYLAVWRAAGSFVGTDAGRGGAMGWMWSIAARRLVDGARRRAREARSDSAPVSAAHAPAAEDAVLATRIDDPMWSALQNLSPELRQVLQAMVLDG